MSYSTVATNTSALKEAIENMPANLGGLNDNVLAELANLATSTNSINTNNNTNTQTILNAVSNIQIPPVTVPTPKRCRYFQTLTTGTDWINTNLTTNNLLKILVEFADDGIYIIGSENTGIPVQTGNQFYFTQRKAGTSVMFDVSMPENRTVWLYRSQAGNLTRVYAFYGDVV